MEKTRRPPERYIETEDKSAYPLELLADTERHCPCGAVAYVPRVQVEWRCTSCHRKNVDEAR